MSVDPSARTPEVRLVVDRPLDVPRERAVITEETRPVLPRSVRLHFDPVRERDVVLSPEKVLWPDEISVEILKLCDGVRSVGAIADSLASDYNAPRDVILADVMEFVQEWTDNLLLKS
jgi:pyrroloquinoline quinone biosynthesis protein D